VLIGALFAFAGLTGVSVFALESVEGPAACVADIYGLLNASVRQAAPESSASKINAGTALAPNEGLRALVFPTDSAKISLTLGLGVGVGAAVEGLGDGADVGPVVGISAPELELLGLSPP
jgi:hypothetical protein